LYSYRQIIPNKESAFLAANMTAAMIDGLWLRSSLSKTSQDEFKKAEQVCKQFIAIQCQLGKDL
jgi:TetR/AcrR family transcriptional repressor of bet genes